MALWREERLQLLQKSLHERRPAGVDSIESRDVRLKCLLVALIVEFEMIIN